MVTTCNCFCQYPFTTATSGQCSTEKLVYNLQKIPGKLPRLSVIFVKLQTLIKSRKSWWNIVNPAQVCYFKGRWRKYFFVVKTIFCKFNLYISSAFKLTKFILCWKCFTQHFPKTLPAFIRSKSTRRHQNIEICSKLIIKSPERRQWRRSSVVIVNFYC